MTAALPLRSYEIDGKTMFMLIAIYLFVSLLVIFVPKRAAPIRLREDNDGYPIEPTSEERGKIIDDMRAKVRLAVIQITGGVLVLTGFIGTVPISSLRQVPLALLTSAFATRGFWRPRSAQAAS
jgi:hypothetical protein